MNKTKQIKNDRKALEAAKAKDQRRINMDLKDRVDSEYMRIFIKNYEDMFKDIIEIVYSEGTATAVSNIPDYIRISFNGEVVYEASGPNIRFDDYRLRKSDLENFLKEKNYENLLKIFIF